MSARLHQYIHRETSQLRAEKIYAARIIHFLYSRAREDSSVLFQVLTSHGMSSLLGFLNFDLPLVRRIA